MKPDCYLPKMDEETLELACQAFAESYVVYPDGTGKTHISDWFGMNAQDAHDFGAIKETRWNDQSDIRQMEYEFYIAAVIKEPMRAAIAAAIRAKASQKGETP